MRAKICGAPDRDIGEVVIAGVPVAITDVDHPSIAVAECDVGGQTSFAQSEGDIVSATEMCLDQRLEREVGQDVAAVGNERICPEPRLRILDPASGFQQHRLVHQPDGPLPIKAIREERFKCGGQMMGVDDERLHAQGREMIEGESDERLLENRDERLRQFLGQRAQPQAEAGAENKGLVNHAPNELQEFPMLLTALHRMSKS